MQTGGRVTQTADRLRERGFAVIARLADPLIMDRVEAELRPHFNAQPPGSHHNSTNRIHSRVLADAPVLQRCIIDSLIIGVVTRLLGPNCVRFQLSSLQGIEVHPGSKHQTLHRDDEIFRLPHPHPIFEVNVMWAVTDFTTINGATRMVPDSHEWPSGQTPDIDAEISVEMAKGSVLLWLGSTWHGAGSNRSNSARIGVYVGYSLGWLRQEEQMCLALPPDSIRDMPVSVQRMIGYELKGSSTLGWLDGRDPRSELGLDA